MRGHNKGKTVQYRDVMVVDVYGCHTVYCAVCIKHDTQACVFSPHCCQHAIDAVCPPSSPGLEIMADVEIIRENGKLLSRMVNYKSLVAILPGCKE